jgi:hypothetical protein
MREITAGPSSLLGKPRSSANIDVKFGYSKRNDLSPANFTYFAVYSRAESISSDAAWALEGIEEQIQNF